MVALFSLVVLMVMATTAIVTVLSLRRAMKMMVKRFIVGQFSQTSLQQSDLIFGQAYVFGHSGCSESVSQIRYDRIAHCFDFVDWDCFVLRNVKAEGGRKAAREKGRERGEDGCGAVQCGVVRRAEGQAVRGLDPAVQQGLCKKEAKGKGGDLRPSSPSTRQLGCLLCGRGCCWEGGEREGAREGCDRPKCELLVFARLDAACHHTTHRTKKPFRCRPLKERWT